MLDPATSRTRRARRADMSRKDFIALVTGWSGELVLVLVISALGPICRLGRAHDSMLLQCVQ